MGSRVIQFLPAWLRRSIESCSSQIHDAINCEVGQQSSCVRRLFPKTFSNFVHEADFFLNEMEGGAPLLRDSTIWKHGKKWSFRESCSKAFRKSGEEEAQRGVLEALHSCK